MTTYNQIKVAQRLLGAMIAFGFGMSLWPSLVVPDRAVAHYAAFEQKYKGRAETRDVAFQKGLLLIPAMARTRQL